MVFNIYHGIMFCIVAMHVFIMSYTPFATDSLLLTDRMQSYSEKWEGPCMNLRNALIMCRQLEWLTTWLPFVQVLYIYWKKAAYDGMRDGSCA